MLTFSKKELTDIITDILDDSTESRTDGSQYLNNDCRNISCLIIDELIKEKIIEFHTIEVIK